MTMNTFVNRFSTTSAVSEIRKARALVAEDDDISDAMWGSQAGFGSLSRGVPSFSIPHVEDVSPFCKLAVLTIYAVVP
jgi:20S proteasome subunit beta 5